jgi:hypothetical protein
MHNAIPLIVAALIAVGIIVIGCFYLLSPDRPTNWRNQEFSQARSNAISFGTKHPLMDRNGSL